MMFEGNASSIEFVSGRTILIEIVHGYKCPGACETVIRWTLRMVCQGRKHSYEHCQVDMITQAHPFYLFTSLSCIHARGDMNGATYPRFEGLDFKYCMYIYTYYIH